MRGLADRHENDAEIIAFYRRYGKGDPLTALIDAEDQELSRLCMTGDVRSPYPLLIDPIGQFIRLQNPVQKRHSSMCTEFSFY
jgi:hypothetical protein